MDVSVQVELFTKAGEFDATKVATCSYPSNGSIKMELILELMDPTIMTLVTTIDGTIVGVPIAHGTVPLGDHRRTEDTTGTSALEVQHVQVGARLVKIGGETTMGTNIAQHGIRIGEIDTVVTDKVKVHLDIAIDGGTRMIRKATVDRSYGM
jgi:hypothetical protein